MKINKWIIVIAATSSLLGFGLGANSIIAKDKKTQIEDTQDLAIPLEDIQRFATVVAQIKHYYIEPVEDSTLFSYAIKGMLSNLDPHSSFLDEESFKDLQAATSGKFGGVGIEVMPDKNGFIKVISPLDDTPAFKAGIKAGDMIVRVNNKLVKDMTLREAINMIRGKRGSTVDLTIIRKGEDKPRVFTLTRAQITIESVKSKMLEEGYGYVRISFFQGPVKRDLHSAIKKLQKESKGKLNGLVLDLRNNPGGLLDSAIDVADAFLDANQLKEHKKLIVYTKGRVPNSDIKGKATRGDLLKGVPMVVLVNQGSASASEIVAGALQDHNRAVVLGEKSFGKGSVQTVIPLNHTTAIKLTTALYYTPAGRSIQAEGIEPDLLIADLKIPQPKTDAIVIEPISEADLEGHLKNGSKKAKVSAVNKEKKVDDSKKPKEIALMHRDFQLYEALNLLKGINIFND